MNFLIIFFSLQGITAILGLINIISKQFMMHVLRFSYSIFLLFSGGLKLIDPLGFSYKLQEYFEAFGVEWLIPSSLVLSVFIILFEILLGFLLLYGVQIKKAMWGNLFLMIFFTFLTFFSAYFNKVTDCGCFGDFMKLDPWHSFFKDIHLLFISVILFIFQSKINPLFSLYYKSNHQCIKHTNRLLVLDLLILLVFVTYTLSHLPVIDFRAYKIGANISEDRKLPENAKKDVYEDFWYYEVNNEIKEFSTSEEPWKIDGAIFKDRVTKLISKGDEPAIHDFDIIDPINFDKNMTDSILGMDQVFLVISYDIEKTNIDAHETVSNFISNSLNPNDYKVYGLSSSSVEDVKDKLLITELLYPYFLVDQTTLKTMIRANPGIFLLKNGVVIEKWHWRDIPSDLSGIIN